LAEDIPFSRGFDAPAGAMQQLTPLVRRIVAPNPSPFTYTGTCTYVVGQGDVAVIDPGPDDPGHIQALLDALGTERVSQIVITHTHRDHSPGARLLQEATGAPIMGAGPHRAARAPLSNEAPRLDASSDSTHRPDLQLAEGEAVEGDGWRLIALETPGHTMNHLAFALPEEKALFSGDHVMAWSTTIVAPPDGSMRDYMASLDKLARRDDRVFWPGHGGPVAEPKRFVRALLGHRRARESAILARLEAGDETIADIVPRLYEGLAPTLKGAAALSVFAHLEDLVARGLAATNGPPTLDARYRRA
jgi:glyoxylase-like metal-dependent hydrolase (beta-lactamase superfamily II)